MSDEETQQPLTEEEEQQWQNLSEKDPDLLTAAEKTSKIKLSIKRRFDPPEWCLAFEVASPDGRRADAVAVNTFPSRNFKIVGFEFKTSRSDWLNEKPLIKLHSNPSIYWNHSGSNWPYVSRRGKCP